MDYFTPAILNQQVFQTPSSKSRGHSFVGSKDNTEGSKTTKKKNNAKLDTSNIVKEVVKKTVKKVV